MVIVRATERNYVDKGWIKGYRNFSFQDFYDEYNDHFGNLIVLNDEQFAPKSGFKLHPTSDLEVVTYVIEGELEISNEKLSEKTSLKPGDIQVLSCGREIMHSEVNKLSDRATSFLQFWFTPSDYGIDPSYCKVSPEKDQLKNQLFRVFSQKKQAAGKIGQDVNFYISALEGGNRILFESEKGRGTLIFVLEGLLKIGDEVLKDRDCMRTMNSVCLDIRAEKDSRFFLVDTK